MTVLQPVPARPQDWTGYAAVPPPPTAPQPLSLELPSCAPAVAVERRPPSPPALLRPGGYLFDAELDASELDDHDRPGSTWTAHGLRLSRSNLSIRTRRMSHAGRRLLLAVHRIDSLPVPLAGVVRSCTYDDDGMYLIDMDLMPVPEGAGVQDWVQQIAKAR